MAVEKNFCQGQAVGLRKVSQRNTWCEKKNFRRGQALTLPRHFESRSLL